MGSKFVVFRPQVGIYFDYSSYLVWKPKNTSQESLFREKSQVKIGFFTESI